MKECESWFAHDWNNHYYNDKDDEGNTIIFTTKNPWIGAWTCVKCGLSIYNNAAGDRRIEGQ